MSQTRKAQPRRARELDVNFDIDNITLDHADEFEDETGVTVDEAFGPRVALMPDGSPVLNAKGEPVFVRRYSAKYLKVLLKIINPALDVGSVRLADLNPDSDGSGVDPTAPPDADGNAQSSPPSGE